MPETDDSGRSRSIDDMLAAATKLRTFKFHKLWVGALSLAIDNLVSVDLHRSDSLGWLKIWAPSLQSLGIQACYALRRLDFLDVHPMQSQLPADHVVPDLVVNTLKANLSGQAKQSLRDHPTATKSGRRHGGMPSENFAPVPGGVAGGAGGGDDWDDEWDDEGESDDEDEDFDEYTDDDDDDDDVESDVEEVD